ncbi:21971_t:CDS:1 [Gigaspora margarita]|uniref:21971_t:CDS:1 n=1 Tax=Gigaspora margarita TaxID=4874 RepID=A0ABN7VX82_GIGMA|nr:21971_t:CDS:1 [Gigaspora margarita]
MVNANEWLNANIPENQRAQAKNLYIHRRNYQTKITKHPNYHFDNIFLEGELNLDDFVNLQKLSIEGIGQGLDEQQKLTGLKIDKCKELTSLTINYTTLTQLNIRENTILQDVNLKGNKLGHLSLNNKVKYQNFDLSNNQQLIFDDDRLKSQVERLISLIRNVKSTNFNDLKLEMKKIEEENFEYQLAVTKNRLSEEKRSLLEILLETQQEVLQNDNTFARKLLEKVKKDLSDVLTAEEIQDFLGKKVEINELEIQLNDLKIREHQEQA